MSSGINEQPIGHEETLLGWFFVIYCDWFHSSLIIFFFFNQVLATDCWRRVILLEKIHLIMLLRLKMVSIQVFVVVYEKFALFEICFWWEEWIFLRLWLVMAPDGTIQWFDIGWVVVENKLGERHTAACPGIGKCVSYLLIFIRSFSSLCVILFSNSSSHKNGRICNEK